ncbi:L-aspartate oxidase [Salipaludibacillus aurantiacus]|uniref:L-aspartate oxidase n=1 Tax=Salipaludibacillus aurantiacus TaxID=1601833 RepID=A0A1H9QAP3_9BACI|nr:FAD-dependent oxidoreductase [Salipaludibacillus aurantiacus]SER56893.1 fumarate reductase (CoM/CoB) subunit A [Salipaludibacillus aurantiacus]
MDIINTDVLIIGSGAAGLSASVYAARSGQKVLVIDKGAVGKSGSTVGAVQIASLGEWSLNGDSEETYFKDIEESGRGLSDPVLAKILAGEITERINELIAWGLKLDVDEKKEVAVFSTAGHSISRSVSARKGKTGLGILQTFLKKARSLKDNLNTWSDVITLELLTSSERVTGALVFDLTETKLSIIHAKTVILATGGMGQLYPVTSNPVQATGDGFSLGLGAGAALKDMEQVQFYPVSLKAPQSVAGFCISFYHYSKLYNKDGHRFMADYEPETLENTTRDKLSLAMASEVGQGRGTENGAVFMDVTHTTDRVKSDFPHEYEMCVDRGVDLRSNRAEVGPAAHFIMGGIQIDGNGASSVPGLYVTGETAGGLHGGNRLGNNALSECLVFGARAGQAAASESAERENRLFPSADVSEWLQKLTGDSPVRGKKGVSPYDIKRKIQSVMDEGAGVVRSDKGLHQARKKLEEIDVLLKEAKAPSLKPYSREVIDFIESRHMVRTAKAIVEAAMHRTESRGAHYNKDHPGLETKPYHTVVTYQDERFICLRQPLKGDR